MNDIGKLITLFKQFGGEFDNVEVRHSKDAGYCCYSLDSSKNSIISCPASLLVDIDDISINENGLFITRPEKYGDRIDFLRKYFAFHFNKAVVSHQSERKKLINSLSEKDLSIISNILPPESYNLKEDKDLEYEKRRVIECHNISHQDRRVIMPFVTFVNFSKNGHSFKHSDKKISLTGKFDGEIFAVYNDNDVLKMGTGYDFITDTKYIYSIPLTYPLANDIKMIINRSPLEATSLGNGRWKPILKTTQSTVTLSWFPLHMEGAPLYPATIAKMIADEINIPAENLLLNIFRLNLHALMPAAFQLKESENEFARYLGNVAQRQLETIAGTR